MMGEDPRDFWRDILKGVITGVTAGIVIYLLQKKTGLRRLR